MGESIWKKEISLGRKKAPKETAAPPAAEAPAAEASGEAATPFWKKEISLGRKKAPKEAAAPPAAEAPAAEASAEAATPFWKKEITLGRKKAPKETVEPAPDAPEAESPKELLTPFWKKEITVGRKKPADAPPASAEPAAQPQAEASAAPEQAPPQPVPFWKKEITLGGGSKKAPAEPQQETGDEVPFWKRDVLGPKREKLNDPVGETPFWKKEITLGRKERKEVERLAEEAGRSVAPGEPEHHEPIKAAEAAAAALIADPNAEIEIFFQAPRRDDDNVADHESAAAGATASSSPDPGAAEPKPPEPASAPEPVTPEPAPRAPEPVDETDAPGLEPLPEPPTLQLPTPPSAAVPPPAPPAPPAPAPSAESERPERPSPVLPVPPVPPVEPQQAAPPAPAEPAPAAPAPAAPEPAARVQPPVPAAELPPLPDEPKVPWWKKEISFSSKPKPQTIPSAVRTAQPSRQSDEQRPFWRKKIEIGRRPAPGSSEEVSIWKKEITFSRKSKQETDSDETATGTGEPKVPWWKKEIGGKKKTAAAVTATTSAAATSAAATSAAATSAAATSAAATPAAATPAAATPPADAPGEPKVPWWKKEIGGKKKSSAPARTRASKASKSPEKSGDELPFWKKELSLKTLKEVQLTLPKRSAGAKTAKASKKGKTNAKRLVGLKVGASQLAAARVVNNGVAEVVQVARRPLEAGIVVGGELRDPDALATQLKTFFAQNKLPKKNVRLGIASNRIGVRIFELAGIQDESQLANAIQFRAQEALPIPLDEAVLDYHVVGEDVDAEGQPVKRILLVVAYRELVERYVAACRKAGVTLVGVDLEAFALLRALAAPRQADEPAKAALVGVAVGHDRSTFAVSDGRVCEFTRVLEWGGAALNVAIARALDLAPSEVEGYKRSLVLDGPAPVPEGLTQEQWGAAVDAVRRQLQSFARELVSSLQFYQNQPGSLGIGEIVLAGGTAHMPGLAEELQRLIGVPVRIGDPLARVRVAKKIAETDQIGSLAVAIGLGIED